MVEALINILAVIAIIAIGAFVIVVLSDLLISIIDGKNGIFFKRGNGEKGKEKEEELPDRPKMVNHVIEEEKPQQLAEAPKQIIYEESNVDMQEAEKEEKLLESKHDEYDFSNFVEEETVTKQSAKSNEAYIDEITEIAKTMLKDEEVEEVQAEDEDEDLDLFDEEIENTEEVEEQPEEETENSISNEELEQIKAELEEQRKAYEALLAEKQEAEEKNKQLETEKEQLVSEKENLQKAIEEQEKNNVEQKTLPTESKEELTAKLEMLKERLKANEKLLKSNKKEYLPLAKINKSLENDTKKLRRKEAKVAKQKVMLYGVNNFVDIDEEKAKELNEELDLLEGLRLSVKHCEEVMNANKDRFPILEQTNQILTNTVQQTKADIAEVKAKLEALNSNSEESDNVETDNQQNN